MMHADAIIGLANRHATTLVHPNKCFGMIMMKKNSDDAPFKKGEVVELVAGGPSMAVSNVDYDMIGERGYTITCQWFSGKKMERGTFPAESLRLCKADGQHGKK